MLPYPISIGGVVSVVVMQILQIDFVRFCLVGVLGFLINLVLLKLTHDVWGWPIFIAQLVSSEIALFHNFLWHHKWTYRQHNVKKSAIKLILEFHATSWVAILGTSLLMSVMVDNFHLHYIYALVIASAIALLWNFAWTKFYVWRHVGQSDKMGEE